MLQALDEFDRTGTEPLLLKVGLHKGHSLAVMLHDRIDYFGQAVNIAARIQNLAAGREICLSQVVYDRPGVGDLLSEVQVEPAEGIMKGVGEKIQVYKVRV